MLDLITIKYIIKVLKVVNLESNTNKNLKTSKTKVLSINNSFNRKMSFNVVNNTDLPSRNFDSLNSDKSSNQELEFDQKHSKTMHEVLKFNGTITGIHTVSLKYLPQSIFVINRNNLSLLSLPLIHGSSITTIS